MSQKVQSKRGPAPEATASSPQPVPEKQPEQKEAQAAPSATDALREMASAQAKAQATAQFVQFMSQKVQSKRGPTPEATASSPQAFFENDVTLHDGTLVSAGTLLTKTWSLRNVGLTAWPASTTAVFVGGSQDLVATDFTALVVPTVAPLACAEVTVQFRAPNSAGSHRADFQLQSEDGTTFGPAFWVDVQIVGIGHSLPKHSPADVPVAFPVPYAAALEVLRNMGFTDEATNNTLLQQHKGNVQEVVVALLHLR
jgi:hypothetical protein